MNTANNIIFGPGSLSKLESEKLDIAQGGDDIEDMSELEKPGQKGQGLKTMTPKQMLVRLPILLAQLKVGNNSQKLKN